MLPVALSIAGSDPSGGAGIQADLKTFHQFGVYGEAVITLLTVQNTVGVKRVECLEPELVAAQIEAVVEDIPPAAAKTGALGNRAIVEVVASIARRCRFPLVVDPVMISKHGAPLISTEARDALIRDLIPASRLITPNIPEAESLAGVAIRNRDDMQQAAIVLHEMGTAAVLIKGGHLDGDAVDLLLDGGEWHEFAVPRIGTRHTHGTGCTFSAAITAGLAIGLPVADAVSRAKAFLTEAIRTNPGLGAGSGPVNHHARVGVG